jgi:hypothetical protein
MIYKNPKKKIKILNKILFLTYKINFKIQLKKIWTRIFIIDKYRLNRMKKLKNKYKIKIKNKNAYTLHKKNNKHSYLTVI